MLPSFRLLNPTLILLTLVMLGVVAMPSGVVECAGQDSLRKTTTMGPVSVTVTLSPRQPVIGDTLELGILVKAENDVEVLMPEFGEALGRFQIADFHSSESLDPDGATSFSQTYSLHSPPSGKQAIPPILVEFVDRRAGEQEAPENLDAYELFSERIDFEIQSVTVSDASAELNPAMGKIEKESSSSNTTGQWASIIIISILVLGTIGLALMIVFFRSNVVRKSAYEIARKQLDQLINLPTPNAEEIDGFYVHLTSIIRTYLEYRFSLRAPELTTEEFLSSVSGSAVLSHSHKKLLNDFLKHADLVKFAGVKPGPEDIRETIAKASQFLEETKENAPLLLIENNSQTSDPIPPKEASGV